MNVNGGRDHITTQNIDEEICPRARRRGMRLQRVQDDGMEECSTTKRDDGKNAGIEGQTKIRDPNSRVMNGENPA